MSQQAAHSRLVPIRTVCAMYNLNPNTLRTWERRYGLVDPVRSEGGHRSYGERDLGNIEGMVRLIGEGHSPSEAARQVKSLATVQPQPPAATHEQPAEYAPGVPRQRFREAIEALSLAPAIEALREASTNLGYQAAVETVVFPELSYWGQRWETTKRNVAKEHLASMAAKTLLFERHTQVLHQAEGPLITLACAPGEHHELPILHVANRLCESGGLRPLLLTCGLPISEIVAVSEQAGSRAIVLSATVQPRPEAVRAWIAELSACGWEERTVLVGVGFNRSRIFSESRVKSAPGNYGQVLTLLRRMMAQPAEKAGTDPSAERG